MNSFFRCFELKNKHEKMWWHRDSRPQHTSSKMSNSSFMLYSAALNFTVDVIIWITKRKQKMTIKMGDYTERDSSGREIFSNEIKLLLSETPFTSIFNAIYSAIVANQLQHCNGACDRAPNFFVRRFRKKPDMCDEVTAALVAETIIVCGNNYVRIINSLFSIAATTKLPNAQVCFHR